MPITIEINDTPHNAPERTDAKVFFPYTREQDTLLTSEECCVAQSCKTVGLNSIEQIEEEFAKIIAHLKKQAAKV